MNMFINVADFLVSQWVWAVTWGIYHVFLSALFMLLLLRIVLGMKWLRALMYTATAHVFAIAIFSFVVIICLMPFIDSDFYMIAGPAKINPGRVTLYLGLIYSLLELAFFMLVANRSKLPFIKLLTVILISNCLAAGFIALTLPCM